MIRLFARNSPNGTPLSIAPCSYSISSPYPFTSTRQSHGNRSAAGRCARIAVVQFVVTALYHLGFARIPFIVATYSMNRSRTAQAEARATLEMELRAADRMLGVGGTDTLDAQAAGPTLTDASVVEVKPEFALVVANIGRNAGVKVGMPFQVWRDNRRVGEVRVIDVRDRISGAVIQNLVSEEDSIKTGDRLRVDARR